MPQTECDNGFSITHKNYKHRSFSNTLVKRVDLYNDLLQIGKTG